MNTETILKQEQITQIVGDFGCGDDCDNQHETARAIEQAVLQSPEIQALREDAELYRWVKNNIKEGYEFDGGYYISDEDTSNWDRTIRAAMEQQHD